MRKFILVLSMLAAVTLQAQNVGIGTNTPQFKLDVNGRMRIRSGGDISNTAGLWLNNIANNASPVFIGMRSDSLTGIFGNNSNWKWLMNTNTGNIALGDFNPSRPLSFPATLEKKISLYPGTTGDAGFGVFGNELRINSDNSNADITLGFDDYQNGFTERMRIKGNGKVGIGTTSPNATLEAQSNITGIPILRLSGVNEAYQDFYPLGNAGGRYGWLGFSASEPDKFFLYNDRDGDMSFITGGGERLTLKNNGNVGIGITDPAYPLDISNRMRIRGKPGFSAGTWLNNEANTGIPAFIGMQTDNQVGFFGSGVGWGLSMNTQNGSLNIAGNSGSAKQVLTSNGSSLAPTWETTKTTTIGYALATGFTPLATNGLFNVPGMTATITLTQTSIVILNYNVYVRNFGCLLCPSSGVGIWLTLRTVTDQLIKTDGLNDIPNDGYRTYVSGPVPLTLSPGTYTFLVQVSIPSLAANHSAGSASLGASIGNSLTWEVSPL